MKDQYLFDFSVKSSKSKEAANRFDTRSNFQDDLLDGNRQADIYSGPTVKRMKMDLENPPLPESTTTLSLAALRDPLDIPSEIL